MNEEQLKLSYKEYSKVSKIIAHLEYIRDLDCTTSNSRYPITLTTDRQVDGNRVQSKVWRIKLDMIAEYYGKADFNYQMFSAVLQDHFENEKKKKQKNYTKDKQDTQDHGKVRSRMESPIVRCFFYILLIVAVMAAFGFLSSYLPQATIGMDPIGLAGIRPGSN